ncbi:MAG TPA: hypothetical protein VFE47_31960 [Tepidisphaeraceae bacterium]|jgi:hypothetical protein|nr:hypothetical protein [Tepidisphaeraceae bacterium]
MTAQQIYEQTIKPLPRADRIRIASFILNDLASGKIDVSDEWSDEDLRDFTAAGWQHVDEALS